MRSKQSKSLQAVTCIVPLTTSRTTFDFKTSPSSNSSFSSFNLPPTASHARSLTVHQKQESVFTRTEGTNKRRKAKGGKTNAPPEDDTPKAFARLMSFQRTGQRMPSGLDDGTKKSKNQKKEKGKSKSTSTSTSDPTATAGSEKPATNASAPEALALKPLPHEPLSHFSARVDQALPLSSIPKHTTRLTQIPGLEKVGKTHLTKHNKRLARMQADWRAQEAKIRTRREEEDDDLADQREEDALLWLSAGVEGGGKKKKKKGAAANDSDDVDPWKVLEKKRAAEGELRQASLQDVVLAPPVLKGVKNIFKEKQYTRPPPSSSSPPPQKQWKGKRR